MIRLRCPHCRRYYAARSDGGIRRHRRRNGKLRLAYCPEVHESELLGGGFFDVERKPTTAATITAAQILELRSGTRGGRQNAHTRTLRMDCDSALTGYKAARRRCAEVWNSLAAGKPVLGLKRTS